MSRSRRAGSWFGVAALGLVALAGCSEIHLAAVTPPPPGKVAELDDSHDSIALSKGVALAFDCVAQGGYYGPCRDVAIAADDPAVVGVFHAYRDTLSLPAWDRGAAGPQPQALFVVAGLSPGTTTLRLETADGDIDLDLEVRDE